ncbi:hypothetical protein [Spongiactinospora sp. 9N601]|uniref:hypothetical protein n=1 Tax=Spongiactinospora sp. 9N601 TaxID=3375149 RepID=UPI0037AF6D59
MAGIENRRLTEDPSTDYPPSPEPRETWPLPGGVAWVYPAPRHRVLTRPVVPADGFSPGHRRVRRAQRGHPGQRFSMGALVTGYALTKMEYDRLLRGEVGTYVSFGSPHRGAWIPISLQALAHVAESIAPKLREQVNSPAARQLLALHTETFVSDPAQDPLREQFLNELSGYGDWPRQPVKLGIANGAGNGVGNGIPPGALTLSSETANLRLRLYAQDNTDDFVVAALRFLTQTLEKKTSGLPRADSAPGGTPASFGTAAE